MERPTNATVTSLRDWVLVVEGGGMRGAYLGGVMGTLTLNGIPAHQFQSIYGVSAGAASAAYYIAGQVGLGFAVWKRLFTERRFVRGLTNVFMGRRVLDLDYLDTVFRELVPLRVERIETCPTDFRIVITNCTEGTAEYVRPSAALCIELLKLTSAFPPFHQPIYYNSRLYADGALSDPIPILRAISDGARRILVVSTTPPAWRASREFVMIALSWLAFPRNRRMRRLYQESYKLYNMAKEVIIHPPPGVEIVAIQPERELPVWQLDTDAKHLTVAMTQGEVDAERIIRDHRLTERIGGFRPRPR